MSQELRKLLRIKPNEVYDFSDDDIIVIKLAHNIDIRHINHTNPFLRSLGDAKQTYWPEMVILLNSIASTHEDGIDFVIEFIAEMTLEYSIVYNLDPLKDCTFDFITRQCKVR